MCFSLFAVKINKMEEKEETVVENAWALKVNQFIIPGTGIWYKNLCNNKYHIKFFIYVYVRFHSNRTTGINKNGFQIPVGMFLGVMFRFRNLSQRITRTVC
jgi:hypothetical protein